jgi:hypothetical protein
MIYSLLEPRKIKSRIKVSAMVFGVSIFLFLVFFLMGISVWENSLALNSSNVFLGIAAFITLFVAICGLIFLVKGICLLNLYCKMSKLANEWQSRNETVSVTENGVYIPKVSKLDVKNCVRFADVFGERRKRGIIGIRLFPAGIVVIACEERSFDKKLINSLANEKNQTEHAISFRETIPNDIYKNPILSGSSYSFKGSTHASAKVAKQPKDKRQKRQI